MEMAFLWPKQNERCTAIETTSIGQRSEYWMKLNITIQIDVIICVCFERTIVHWPAIWTCHWHCIARNIERLYAFTDNTHKKKHKSTWVLANP